jgi:hypothetical protein
VTHTTPPSPRGALPARVLHLFRRCERPALALIDQGSISGAHLLLNVMLARTLDLASYGAFATAFVCGLLAAVVHAGALLDPMAIIASSHRGDAWPAYAASQVREHLRVSVRLALLPLGAGAATALSGGPQSLTMCLVLTAASLPAVLGVATARRLLLVSGDPRQAAYASSMYAATIGCGAVLLHNTGRLDLVTTYCLMTGAGLVGSLPAVRRVGWQTVNRAFAGLVERVGPEQRQHARTLVPAGVLAFAVSQLPLPAVSMLLDTSHAGTYRAMQLPMIAVGQVITAMCTMALPRLSAAFADGDVAGMRRQTRVLACGLLVTCLGVELTLIAGHATLAAVLLGDRFVEVSWLMPLFGLVGIVSCVGTAVGTALRAMRRSQTQTVAAAAMAVVGVPAALVLIQQYGVAGAAASSVLGYAVFTAVNVHYYSVDARAFARGRLSTSAVPHAMGAA